MAQAVHRERLGHHVYAGVQEASAHGGVLGVGGDEQHPQIMSRLPRDLRELAIVETRQPDVSDEKVDPSSDWMRGIAVSASTASMTP